MRLYERLLIIEPAPRSALMNALVMGVPSKAAAVLRQWANAGGFGPIIVSTALILVVCMAVAVAGWAFGVLASAAGLCVSAAWGFPTGASVVAMFGVLFMCWSIARSVAGAIHPMRKAG